MFDNRPAASETVDSPKCLFAVVERNRRDSDVVARRKAVIGPLRLSEHNGTSCSRIEKSDLLL